MQGVQRVRTYPLPPPPPRTRYGRKGHPVEKLIQLKKCELIKKTEMNCFSSNLSLYPDRSTECRRHQYPKLSEQINIPFCCWSLRTVTGFEPRLWVMTLWKIFAVDTQFKQLRKRSLKKIQASAGFEPVTSAIPVQCSTNWAMKP